MSEIPCSERKRQSIRAPSVKADVAEDLTQERWRRPSKHPERSYNPTAMTILSLPGKCLIGPNECFSVEASLSPQPLAERSYLASAERTMSPCICTPLKRVVSMEPRCLV